MAEKPSARTPRTAAKPAGTTRRVSRAPRSTDPHAAKAPLRIVIDAEEVAAVAERLQQSEPTLSVTEAAKRGTTRQLLVAMRDRIAEQVEDADTPARDLAALTKRLMETVREIEAIDAREEEAGADAEASDGEFDAEAI